MHKPASPNLETIFSKVRAAASKKNPEATFAGECLNNLDLDSRWLDYTWNWALFDERMDWRALVNAYPTPRFNVNVGTSPRAVKQLFADHLFLNVLPSKPDGINGSARITEHAGLSKALKQCANLHQQFQNYFEDGQLVGDSILSEPCSEARVNGYVLPDKALVVVLNNGTQPRSIALKTTIEPWLTSPLRRYVITVFNESGAAQAIRIESGDSWQETVPVLAPNELVLIEIVPQK
jgi:hypothetical protein